MTKEFYWGSEKDGRIDIENMWLRRAISFGWGFVTLFVVLPFVLLLISLIFAFVAVAIPIIWSIFLALAALVCFVAAFDLIKINWHDK